MNHLPKNALIQKKTSIYEVKRLQELYPTIASFDYILDIHTTSAMAEPMVIILDQKIPNIAKALDIKTIICKIQKGIPFIAFCGQGKSIRIGIECGIHNSSESKNTAYKATKKFLQKIRIIKGKKSSQQWRKFNVYKVNGSIMAPQNCQVLFPPKNRTITHPDEELLFTIQKYEHSKYYPIL